MLALSEMQRKFVIAFVRNGGRNANRAGQKRTFRPTRSDVRYAPHFCRSSVRSGTAKNRQKLPFLNGG
jgi:hypothetical protein